MRIKKVSQTTPTQAQVVDGYSASTTDSYSCNYVNGLNTFSTTEQRIGTWIDGKLLYRKVVNLGNLPNATTKNVSHGLTIANVNIVHFYGIAKNGNTYLNLPHCSVNNTNDSMFIDGNNILIQCVENRSAFTGCCIIEYTKTTN